MKSAAFACPALASAPHTAAAVVASSSSYSPQAPARAASRATPFRASTEAKQLRWSASQTAGTQFQARARRAERRFDVAEISAVSTPVRGASGTTQSQGKKARVAIVGAGLASLAAAVDLVDQGHEVEIFESRNFVGGKVGSWVDKDGNHIEMGLHVFFGCYYKLFGLMAKLGILESLLLKEHTHTFVNKGGKTGALDFRFPVGAPLNGLKAFFTTDQLSAGDKLANSIALGTSPIVRALVDPEGAMRDIRNLDGISFTDWFKQHGGSQGSIDRMWNPIAYALGFIDCDNISARCMLTIFQFFATKTEASVLRMLEGSPHEFLHAPIVKYLEERGTKINLKSRVTEIKHTTDAAGLPDRVTGMRVNVDGTEQEVTADVYLAACDVPGIHRLLPESFRKHGMFDRIYSLEAVPVATVQLRFDGWVTELQDESRMRQREATGLDNLLYSADADFSCFADLALTSPSSYYREGEGSLMQLVLTPGDPWIGVSNEKIAEHTLKQVHELFPSSRNLNCTWSSVVKLAQSLYRESPGSDVFRPTQTTPIPNFFLAGSYTMQDYIDSMEGATQSGQNAARDILKAIPSLV
eukprot:tig00000219_g19482.t1